jgi:hypothetical protein
MYDFDPTFSNFIGDFWSYLIKYILLKKLEKLEIIHEVFSDIFPDLPKEVR